MMWLALDTSTARGSLALWDAENRTLLAEETFQADRSHNAALFAPLGRLLQSHPSAKIQGILAGTGPGSYSGIRVGLAVANALSLALHAPVIGWPSIAALPDAGDGEFWVTGDARRGSAWLLPLAGARIAGEAVLCESAEAYRAALHRAQAAGQPVYFPSLSEADPFPFEMEASMIRRAAPPSARLLAERVSQVIGEAERLALSQRPLEPIYLREPYFTTPNPRL